VLKDHYADELPLVRALGAAIAGLAGQGNGEGTELGASQLEVGILARDRVHRTFRRLTGARLELLLAEAAGGDGVPAPGAGDEPQPGEAASPDEGVTP
jgi:proteasome alpha subunit